MLCVHAGCVYKHIYIYIYTYVYIHIYTHICVYCMRVFARLGGSLLRRQEGLSPPPAFPLSLLVLVILYSSLTPAFRTYQLVVLQPTSISNSWASLDTDSREITVFSQLGLWPYVSPQKGPI